MVGKVLYWENLTKSTDSIEFGEQRWCSWVSARSPPTDVAREFNVNWKLSYVRRVCCWHGWFSFLLREYKSVDTSLIKQNLIHLCYFKLINQTKKPTYVFRTMPQNTQPTQRNHLKTVDPN